MVKRTTLKAPYLKYVKPGHQINYQKIGRGGEIRTPDPLLPKQMRYQAALHPDCPIHREKITANQALTKVFYNDYEFKSRKPTLIKKI